MFKHVVDGVQVAVLGLTAFAVVMLFANDGGGTPTVAADAGFPQAQQAADLFAANCAGCHGADGGGNVGPSLQGIEGRMSEAGQAAVVTNGRGGMPAFGGRLTEEQIQFLVRFTREVL